MTQHEKGNSEHVVEQIERDIGESWRSPIPNPLDIMMDGLLQTPAAELDSREAADLADRKSSLTRGIEALAQDGDALDNDTRKLLRSSARSAISSLEYAQDRQLSEVGASSEARAQARTHADGMREQLDRATEDSPEQEDWTPDAKANSPNLPSSRTPSRPENMDFAPSGGHSRGSGSAATVHGGGHSISAFSDGVFGVFCFSITIVVARGLLSGKCSTSEGLRNHAFDPAQGSSTLQLEMQHSNAVVRSLNALTREIAAADGDHAIIRVIVAKAAAELESWKMTSRRRELPEFERQQLEEFEQQVLAPTLERYRKWAETLGYSEGDSERSVPKDGKLHGDRAGSNQLINRPDPDCLKLSPRAQQALGGCDTIGHLESNRATSGSNAPVPEPDCLQLSPRAQEALGGCNITNQRRSRRAPSGGDAPVPDPDCLKLSPRAQKALGGCD